MADLESDSGGRGQAPATLTLAPMGTTVPAAPAFEVTERLRELLRDYVWSKAGGHMSRDRMALEVCEELLAQGWALDVSACTAERVCDVPRPHHHCQAWRCRKPIFDDVSDDRWCDAFCFSDDAADGPDRR